MRRANCIVSILVMLGGAVASPAASGQSARVSGAASDSLSARQAEWRADSFDSNAYASKTAAARALADQWGRAVSGMRQKDPKVVLVGGTDKVPESAYYAMVEVLKTHFPTSEIRYEPDLPEIQALPSPGADPAKGFLRMMPTNPNRALLWFGHSQVELLEKPWVDDFAGFMNAQPGKKWIVGETQKPAGSPKEASQQACRDASGELAKTIRPWVARWGMGNYVSDDRRLAERIEQLLQDSRFAKVITDRFAQRFQRSYGNVYREAILIDASERNLDVLAREIAEQVRYERSWTKRTLVSGAAMLAVVYALYLLVNAVTKGYFTWKLRFLAAATCIGLIVLLAAVA